MVPESRNILVGVFSEVALAVMAWWKAKRSKGGTVRRRGGKVIRA